MSKRRGDVSVGAIAIVAGLFLVIIAIFMSATVVPVGSVAVQTFWGNVTATPIEPGMHLVNPLSSLHKMSVQQENYIMSAKHDEGQKQGDDSIFVKSSNGLEMTLELSVPHALSSDAAVWVFKNWGIHYEDKFLRQAIRSGTRQACSGLTDQEIYSTKRRQLADLIKVEIDNEISKLVQSKDKNGPKEVVVIAPIMLNDITLPKTIRDAIERKQKSDQEAQEMEFKILKEEKEAKRKSVEADGIAVYQKKITQGLEGEAGNKFLRWKGLETTEKIASSPNAKVIIAGTGGAGLPVLLGALEASKDEVPVKK